MKKNSFLFMLIFIVLFSQFCFSNIIDVNENQELNNCMLSSFVTLVENQMNKNLEIQRILSRTAELKSGKWMLAKELISTYQLYEEFSLIWYSLPDGNYYRSDIGLTDKNLFDREYFPKLLNKNEVFGSMVTGKTSGNKSIIIAVPVISNSEVVSILGSSIYCNEFADHIVKAINLPQNIFFFVLDSDGNIIINSNKEMLIENTFNEGTTSLKESSKRIFEDSEGYDEFEYNNKLHKIIFKKSLVTGWYYVIGEIINY